MDTTGSLVSVPMVGKIWASIGVRCAISRTRVTSRCVVGGALALASESIGPDEAHENSGCDLCTGARVPRYTAIRKTKGCAQDRVYQVYQSSPWPGPKMSGAVYSAVYNGALSVRAQVIEIMAVYRATALRRVCMNWTGGFQGAEHPSGSDVLNALQSTAGSPKLSRRSAVELDNMGRNLFSLIVGTGSRVSGVCASGELFGRCLRFG